jgi:hypothetical protein
VTTRQGTPRRTHLRADGIDDLHCWDVDAHLLSLQESPGSAGTVGDKYELGPLIEQGGGRRAGGCARVEVGEVFHAELDHIGAAQDAGEPGPVRMLVGDRQLGSIITRVSGGTSLAIRRSMLVAMGSITRARLPECRAVTPSGSEPESSGYSRAQEEVPAR